MKTRLVTSLLTATAVAALVLPDIAHAATWQGANANWSASSSNPGWDTTAPNGAGAVAIHSGSTNSFTTQDIVGLVVGTISLTNNSNNQWTIDGTNAITFDSGGAGPALISNSNITANTTNYLAFTRTTSGTFLILADDLLVENTGNSTRTSASGGAIQFGNNSIISGTGNITLSNAGNDIAGLTNVIRFAGALNTFTGGVLVQKGLTTFTGGNSTNGFAGVASNTITIGEAGQGAATLLATAGSTIANNIVVAAGAGGTLTIGGANITSNFWQGGVTLNGDLNVRSNSTTTNFNAFQGIISGSGSLSTTGQVSINKANTYTGATNVNSGLFKVLASGSLNSTSSINVAAGATVENANGASIVRPFSLAEGAILTTSAAGSGFAPSTLTLTGDLSDGFTAVAFNNTAGNGLLKSGGALVLTLSNVALGTYDLDGSSTGFSGVFGSAIVNGFSLSTTDSGATFTGTGGGFAYTFTNATNTLLIAIPEPGTFAMLLCGVGVLVGIQRRRRGW